MLNIESLDSPPPEYYCPLATDEEVHETITSVITRFANNVDKQVRLTALTPQIILELKGGTSTALLRGAGGRLVGEVEHARLQRIGLEVMSVFGLDPNHGYLAEKYAHSENVMSETTIYPSVSIPSLVFQRKCDYTIGTNVPIRISWSVHDTAPDIRLHILGWLQAKLDSK